MNTDQPHNQNLPDDDINSELIDYLHPNDCLIFYGLIKRAMAVSQPDIYRLSKIEIHPMSKSNLKVKLISDFSRSEFLTTNKINGSIDKSIYLVFDDIYISGSDTERFDKLDDINSKLMHGSDFLDEVLDISSQTFNSRWENIIQDDKYYFTFLEARMYFDFIKPESDLMIKIEEGFQHLYNMRIGYFPDFLQKRIEDEYYKNAVNTLNNERLLAEIIRIQKKVKKLIQVCKLRASLDAKELSKYLESIIALNDELNSQPEVLINFDRKNIKGKDYFLSNIKYFNRKIAAFIKKNQLEKIKLS